MVIIPAIDLRDGRCVRLTQGRKDNLTVYDGDPSEIAKSYEAAGAQMVHIVDLDGAFSNPNSHNRDLLREIVCSLKIPVQFGGGLRGLRDVEQVIGLGVKRVVIGTLAVEEPKKLEQMLQSFGTARIAVGIDARDGQVQTHGWEMEGKLSAIRLAQKVAAMGVERIVYTDVTRDGMLTGVNLEQTWAIARGSGLKVTASGGVSSLDDLQLLLDAQVRLNGISNEKELVGRIDSVIIGKALYEGRFTLQQALKSVEPTHPRKQS